MKRTAYLSLVATLLAGMAVSFANAQSTPSADPSSAAQDTSLGAYARSVRNQKKQDTVKQYDNDNLPADNKLSVVGSTTQATTGSADGASATEKKPDDKAAEKPAVQPGQSPEERQAVYDAWQQKIASQKAQVDLLSRELDVTQREYKLRQAAMYGDAGDRLRNSAEWDKQDAEYKQQLAEKQKAVDDAKNDLNDMQEDARKSGVPSSVSEDTTLHETPAQPGQPQTQNSDQPK